eukprot:796386_1
MSRVLKALTYALLCSFALGSRLLLTPMQRPTFCTNCIYSCAAATKYGNYKMCGEPTKFLQCGAVPNTADCGAVAEGLVYNCAADACDWPKKMPMPTETEPTEPTETDEPEPTDSEEPKEPKKSMRCASKKCLIAGESCEGKKDGNYRFCAHPNKFVMCSNGYRHNMDCATKKLVFECKKK